MYELKRGDMDLKQVVSESLYRKEWNTIEDEKTQPCFLREIISIGGRWFMRLYSNVSDYYDKRLTCYGVEDQVLSLR